jgi:hypothetical protein
MTEFTSIYVRFFIKRKVSSWDRKTVIAVNTVIIHPVRVSQNYRHEVFFQKRLHFQIKLTKK